MSDNMTLQTAGVKSDGPLAAAVEARSDIFALTQATQDAVLSPRDEGGLSSEERTAFACRMARLSHETELAARYEALMPSSSATARNLADVSFDGGDDRRLKALIRHVDLVTTSPKAATQQDIEALKTAGVVEADIVRLAELIAFINYQIRVVAGIRLMGELS